MERGQGGVQMQIHDSLRIESTWHHSQTGETGKTGQTAAGETGRLAGPRQQVGGPAGQGKGRTGQGRAAWLVGPSAASRLGMTARLGRGPGRLRSRVR